MGFSRYIYFWGIILISSTIKDVRSKDVPFHANYDVIWAPDHVRFYDQGREIHLSIDNRTGSGFRSKLKFQSGLFQMWIKLPRKDSAGIVTAFYLFSNGGNHDEVDFEFLGNVENQPITLQTNLFANDGGGREQRIHLWFDPSAAFHSYRILWNPYHIVWYVDNVPIRVFKNNVKRHVNYPTHPMWVDASIWDGEGWATGGGKTKANWSHAPFVSGFRGFTINGCSIQSRPSIHERRWVTPCYHSKYWWNGQKYMSLTTAEHRELENVRRKYMTYDYCTDKKRFKNFPPECPYNP